MARITRGGGIMTKVDKMTDDAGQRDEATTLLDMR
jgi:hypothetical protein